MDEMNGVHLPQIEWFYDEGENGRIYPFIGKADLKTLIEWRTSKINSETFNYYSKDARYTYFQHLDCIEQCVKILFSNPTPNFALNEIEKVKKLKENKEKERQVKADEFFDSLTNEGKTTLLAFHKNLKL